MIYTIMSGSEYPLVVTISCMQWCILKDAFCFAYNEVQLETKNVFLQEMRMAISTYTNVMSTQIKRREILHMTQLT